ncbi:glycosyltransferase family A protein [Coraliomargarita parva]|uniref:glycosyltransferase family A protein n=1 Tax=Coraliomargarita parva TaxID=3014050 RepID=UPI0022B3489E|nr:glycosyltransferase family A protein [Coraliomargarita parva]
MNISILLCTHNPRRDYLEATIESLRELTPTDDAIEFLLVDNASESPLDDSLLKDFPFPYRIVREARLGLTHARVAGFKASRGELLLLVDDDNILEPDYLVLMHQYFQQSPSLGCAGGNIEPEFEKPAPPGWETLVPCLALRTVEEAVVTDKFSGAQNLPYGAGMCIRRSVYAHYVNLVETDSWRQSLDRKGGMLTSGGDLDMACCAYDLGMTCGLFPKLKLTHLIPAERTSPRYLKNLAVGIAASCHLLWNQRGYRRDTFLSMLGKTVKTLLRGRNLRRRCIFLRGSWLAFFSKP